MWKYFIVQRNANLEGSFILSFFISKTVPSPSVEATFLQGISLYPDYLGRNLKEDVDLVKYEERQ